jgi:hypothetical protein
VETETKRKNKTGPKDLKQKRDSPPRRSVKKYFSKWLEVLVGR